MESWLYRFLRGRLAQRLRDERGQSELLIIALIVFIVFLVTSGRRFYVQ
jgi:hypothetical protein